MTAATLAAGLLLTAAAADAPVSPPGRAAVRSALDRAVRFFRTELAAHGGYVWRYSRDGALSEGEAETDGSTVWVQPPGTPRVGEAFLDAYDATGEDDYLRFAEDAGVALARGRMQSGGWDYAIFFAPDERAKRGYVDRPARPAKARGRDRGNVTTLDDDTTQAAIRFLARLNDRLGGSNAAVAGAVRAALDAVVLAQRANGGWSREWRNDWPGRYFLNDDVAGQTIRALLEGYDRFGDPRYLRAAVRGGEFLQSARLPEPQPAWAQQYDAGMRPCWDRKFEPPAVSGEESFDAIGALIGLAERTGETRFLDNLGRSLDYLEGLEIAPGMLARFYELGTGRPLYFTQDYGLTYDGSDVPGHYAFTAPSRVDALRAKLRRVRAGHAKVEPKPDAAEVGRVIATLDRRGAWVNTSRGMRGFGKASPEGVIESEQFARNVRLLSRHLTATRNGDGL